MTTLVNSLESLRLVERGPSADDRRVVQLAVMERLVGRLQDSDSR